MKSTEIKRRILAALTVAIGAGWRLLLPRSRCHARPAGGCTRLGQVAALTYGLAAIPLLLALAGDCWQEHHDR